MRKASVRGFVVGLIAAAMFLSVAVTAQAGEATVLGHFCIRDAKGLAAKIVKLVNKFWPGAGDAMVAPQAKELFEKAGWIGVDWSKPISVALLSGKAFGKTEPVPVGIMPVADAEAIKAIIQEAGGPKFLDVRGGYVIFADEEAALKAITDQRLAIYSKFPKIAGSTDLYATFYIARALTEYMPEIEEGIRDAEAKAKAGGAAGMLPGMAGPLAMFDKIAKAAAPLAKLAGKQARRVSIMIQFNDNSVDIAGRLYAMQDSELQTLFDGQPQETTDLTKYLPADCVMGVAGNLAIAKFRPMVDAVLNTLAGPLEIKPEDQQKITDLMFASTQTGESAVGLSGNPLHKGIQTIQIVKIADPAKYREATKDGMDWLMGSGLMKSLGAMGMEMDIDYKPKVREYKGVPVDRITVTYKQAPGAQPNPMMPNRPPQTTEIAALDTYGLAASGDASADLLNAAIDRIKGQGGPALDTSPAYKAAAGAAREGACLVGYISFNSFLAKMVEEIAKIQPMIAMMAGGIAKANPAEQPITAHAWFAKYRAGSAVNFRISVPHQPILDLTQRVQMMMQQMQRPGPAVGPAPPDKGDDDDF